MGVITCDRRGCDNIMSEYQTPIGNVCWECKNEFVGNVDDSLPIQTQLESFMTTRKEEEGDKRLTAEDYFLRYKR